MSNLVTLPLDQVVLHILGIYDRRDRLVLAEPAKRLLALSKAIGDVEDAIRKDKGLVDVQVALARVLVRLFRLSARFRRLPLSEVLAKKYPLRGCSYCQQKPCGCSENRPPSVESVDSLTSQLNWSLDEWQQHLSGIYGAKNRARGFEYLLNRLYKEVNEIMVIELTIPFGYSSMDEIELEYAREIADALCWTLAIANYYGVKLSTTLNSRYQFGCPRCKHRVCQCIQKGFGTDSPSQTVG